MIVREVKVKLFTLPGAAIPNLNQLRKVLGAKRLRFLEVLVVLQTSATFVFSNPSASANGTSGHEVTKCVMVSGNVSLVH